ncbi:MAG: phospholipid carrier-dependent glycosyltransferase [Deltaproteobacteria bacterium]|nr:phospholipid carrier-dependent glycosyltransferase [Deltaproteobacteria bacterium]
MSKLLSEKKYQLIILALALYFLALGIRLYKISMDETSADELHWLVRSHEIEKKYKAGNYAHLTTHLDHPGAAPAIIMAVAQSIASAYNQHFSLKEGNEFYIDRMTAARVSIVLFATLVVPLIFLFAHSWLGFAPALIAALFVTFDPIHIAICRQAHLDALLTLFIVVATLLFIKAELGIGNLKTRLWAGAFWGLALATKFTAVGFVAGVCVYRVLRALIVWIKERRVIAILSWADIWTLLIGHAVMGLLYSRMWWHEFGILQMRHVKSHLADYAYEIGLWLHLHSILPILCAVILLGLAVYQLRRSSESLTKRPLCWPWHLMLFFAILLFIQTLLPAFIENFIRFYTRAEQLKDVPHLAYGNVRPRIPYGYLTIYYSRLSELMQLGTLLGLFTFACSLRRPGPVMAKQFALLIIVVLTVVWVAILNVSPKQTIRYIIPVIALSSLLVAYGWESLVRACSKKIKAKSVLIYTVALGMLLSAQAYLVFSISPHYLVYYSSISGGVKGAYRHGLGIANVGTADVLAFLQKQEAIFEGSKVMHLIGDLEIFRDTVNRLFPNINYKFVSQSGEAYGHNLIVFWPYYQAMQEHYRQEVLETDLSLATKLYEGVYGNEPLVTLYRFPFSDLTKPIVRKYVDVPRSRGVGRVGYYLNNQRAEKSIGREVVTLNPQRDIKGYAARNYSIMLLPGAVKLRALIGIPNDIVLNSDLTPKRYAIRIEMSRSCSRIVTMGELSKNEMRWVELICSSDNSRDYQVAAYWFGNVPLILEEFEIVSAH